jgi:hypothetical protein
MPHVPPQLLLQVPTQVLPQVLASAHEFRPQEGEQELEQVLLLVALELACMIESLHSFPWHLFSGLRLPV